MHTCAAVWRTVKQNCFEQVAHKFSTNLGTTSKI